MNRRTLFKSAIGAALALKFGQAVAATETDREVMLCHLSIFSCLAKAIAFRS